MSNPDAGDLAFCHACGGAMDVSTVGPFTNVACPACGEHTRVKCQFGPYTLERRHAIGGMSMVYVAADPTLGREVVVKILSEEYSADENRIRAFEEEARITASFSHPNVVRVFTTGRAFGRFFIAMEFVPGGHFEHHIRERGRIPEDEALSLAKEVASGLKAAKSAGLIHRDVKPGNILLDENGSAKLVDFGLALVTQGGKATATELWATPYYVPPETIEGREEDFRSDIYAFGATFYHALAGQPPCDEETMDTLRLRKAKQNITPLGKAAPWVSPGTAAVIDRCMAFRPDDRFASYDELLSALRSAAQGEMPAGASEAAPRKRQAGRGEKIAWVAGGAVVVAALAVAVRAMMPAESEEMPPPEAVVVETLPASDPPAPIAAPESAAQIVQAYREAGSALAGDDFDTARARFAEVRDHPEVMQPTGIRAACEAVACAWLAGRSDEARDELRSGISHFKSATSLAPALRQTLLDHFETLGGYPPVLVVPTTDDTDVDRLLNWLSALKNWDQGMMELARALLEPLAAGDDVMASLAGRYLADLDRLAAAEPQDFHPAPAEAKRMAGELETVYQALETRGRAPFNVRAWQLALERAARRVEEPVAQEEPSEASVRFPWDAWKDIKRYAFREAAAKVSEWQPDDPQAVERKEVLLQLIGEADEFLRGLADRPVASEGTVIARDGREFPRVLKAEAEGLTVGADDGTISRLEWAEVEADSLIDLHRAAAMSAGDGALWHQRAVAFDYLAGDSERARAAVAKLSGEGAEFVELWEKAFRLVTPPR